MDVLSQFQLRPVVFTPRVSSITAGMGSSACFVLSRPVVSPAALELNIVPLSAPLVYQALYTASHTDMCIRTQSPIKSIPALEDIPCPAADGKKR